MLIGKTFDILALSQRVGTEFQTLVAGYLGNKASCLSISASPTASAVSRGRVPMSEARLGQRRRRVIEWYVPPGRLSWVRGCALAWAGVGGVFVIRVGCNGYCAHTFLSPSASCGFGVQYLTTR